VGSEAYYLDVLLFGTTDSLITNVFFASGRPALQSDGAARMRVTDNTFQAAKDAAIAIVGGSPNVTVSHNLINNSVTTGIGGPPHGINLEDSDNGTFDSNSIMDGTGFVESGANCIQAYPNRRSVLTNITVTNNVCAKNRAGTYAGFVGGGPHGYNNLLVRGNSFTGCVSGILLTNFPANVLNVSGVVLKEQ
jgi:hypothetical protein